MWKTYRLNILTENNVISHKAAKQKCLMYREVTAKLESPLQNSYFGTRQ